MESPRGLERKKAAAEAQATETTKAQRGKVRFWPYS
jgi:hypothetical protein